jgi:hypothetical protein
MNTPEYSIDCPCGVRHWLANKETRRCPCNAKLTLRIPSNSVSNVGSRLIMDDFEYGQLIVRDRHPEVT